jgi:acetyltransferase-like isoleucine patch superfamily enzyme
MGLLNFLDKFSITPRIIAWIDEKLEWNRYKFMSWYCKHLFRLKCAEIGDNFQVTQFVKKPFIEGLGKIRLGRDVTIVGAVDLSCNNNLFNDCEIFIGDGTIIGRDCSIRAKQGVRIGKNCLLAPYVRIYDHSGHPLDPKTRLAGEHEPMDQIREVVIGDNVWIGEFAHIQKGVRIGDGSIIAAHSVVVNDVAENSVVMGVPARKILWLDPDKTIPGSVKP